MQTFFYSGDMPIRLRFWPIQSLERVFAGCDCVMAITARGKVLQWVADPQLREDLESWTDIRDIAVSQHFPGLAAGLSRDGSCLITEKALRRACETGGVRYTAILQTVRSWQNIRQIVISDAIFALDRHGMVHCAPLTRNTYRKSGQWRNISRIAAGIQDSLFAIDRNGRVCCDGGNCLYGPMGDMTQMLQAWEDVVDICALGAECSRILLARRDGTVVDAQSGACLPMRHGGVPVFFANYCAGAVLRQDGTAAWIPYYFPDEAQLQRLEGVPLRSAAFGHISGAPFLAALTR